MEYFIENTALTSLPIIDSDYLKTRYFYYKGRDFLSSLGIFNTNFKSIDIEFPTRSIAPHVTYFPEATGGSIFLGTAGKYRFFDFGGTQNLYVSGNHLTDLKLRVRMFSGTTCNANYSQHDISINNNANLSSADLTVDVRNHALGNSDQASYFNFNFKNNVIKDLDINVNSLLGVNYSRLSSQSDFTWRTLIGPYYITATFDLSSSQLLESFNVNTSHTGVVNTLLSSYNGNPTYYFSAYLSATPMVYEYPIPEYNSFRVLKGDAPFNEDTIDNFRLLDFSNLKSSNVNFYNQYINFTRLNSSISHLLTTTEILPNGVYGAGVYPKTRQYLFNGDSIPVERMFDILTNIVGMPHSNQVAVDYPYVVTNKNTLFGYQHTLITEPISGRRQPWTFYRPITGYQSVNPNFGMNKNITYSWPISVLNNVSRMAFYQGPFASGPLPYTLIHPRYAITANHWNYGLTFPYNTAFFDTNTNTRTNVTVITAARISSTDIRIVKLQNPLPLSSFPGMYLLPYTLYTSNTATKMPPFMPSFIFSQDYDITPTTTRIYEKDYFIDSLLGSDSGAILSTKAITVGNSGHPVFTFVNNKPVLLGTFASPWSGPSPSGKGLYELIQSKIDELEGQPTQLNIITQEDIDIYDDYTAEVIPSMNVSQFGAVGDGITNDQPAIQAAIDYCSNNNVETLYFNSGVYYLSSTATGTGTPVPNTNGVGYGAGENLNIGFYPEPLSAISYNTFFNNINYKPISPKKINLNLIGTGSTILSARKNDRVTRFGGQASIIALRENINNFKMKGLSLVWDGYLTGDQEFQAQGVIIASNYGGATYGRTAFWPIDRNRIDIFDCTFINCSRSISSGSSILSGRGTNTVNITGCNFLYPKGSDSTSTIGGSQVLLFGYDTLNLNITDNFAEGTTTIPVNSPNYKPKDGFIFYGGINNRYERNILSRFDIETIYGSTGSPAMGCLSGSIVPYVGETITLTAGNVVRNPGSSNRSCISTLTAYQGFGIGDIISYGMKTDIDSYIATYGIYRIDNLIEKPSTVSYEIYATRLSGADYGGEFANLRVANVGRQLSSYNIITPFNFQNKIGSKTYVLDNTFTAGIAVSSPTITVYSHQPAVRADAGYIYLSGNSMPALWAFYGQGQSGFDYKSEWVVENNTIYCCSSANHPDLSNLSIYKGTVRNNNFYFWSDFVNNNNLVYTSPKKITNSYRGGTSWAGVFINWGHTEYKQTYPITADAGQTIIIDNNFYCTYPLSANTIIPVLGATKFDIISGNNILNEILPPINKILQPNGINTYLQPNGINIYNI